MYYGFTKNGSEFSGSCTAVTSDTIGAQVWVTIEAADVGKVLTARINLYIDGTNKGEFNSDEFTPTSTGYKNFNILFTGVPTQIGTYLIGYGGASCAYIYYSTNLGSYVCYSCTTTECTSLAVTLPPPCDIPVCNIAIA